MFNEQWFSHESCEALAELVRMVAKLDGDIVEIGSWQGRSTVAMARAAAPEIVHAVDTWRGSPGEVSQLLAAGRDVFAEFRANVDAETAGNVEAHRVGWRDYFATNDRPLKLVFIDAEHTYTEVRDNIAVCAPRMVEGGFMCGDDIHHPPVQRAVRGRLPSAATIASLWVAQF